MGNMGNFQGGAGMMGRTMTDASPLNGQMGNGGSSLSFVKMSVYSSMNCQSMVVNATSIESGKCYTYGNNRNRLNSS